MAIDDEDSKQRRLEELRLEAADVEERMYRTDADPVEARERLVSATEKLRERFNALADRCAKAAWVRTEGLVARLMNNRDDSLDSLRYEVFSAFVEVELMRDVYESAARLIEGLDPDRARTDPHAYKTQIDEHMTALVSAVEEVSVLSVEPAPASETLQ